jgi:hypothetical protein
LLGSNPSIDELRRIARHDRDRLALYKQKAFSGRLTSDVRLRELERAAAQSEERLRVRLRTTDPETTP